MSLLKPVTLLLIAAIANPMCCCLSFAETDLEAATKAEFDPHACCKVVEDANQSSETAPEGDHDCFHEEIENTKYSDNSGFASNPVHGPIQQIVGYVGVANDCLASRSHVCSYIFDRPEAFYRHSANAYAQKYCVFIL